MKKNKNFLIIILIIVILVSAIVIFLKRETSEGPIIENNNGTSSSATTTPAETAEFNETGNIMINNPGFEKDVFYFSYEKPGRAGLAKKLIFNENSICVQDEELKCNEVIPEKNKEKWSGERIDVKGNETEEGIVVERLEFLDKKEINTEEEREEIAENWILNNSPTYNYDGKDLQFIEERGLDSVDCEDCYEIEFEFTSTHGGYGDRTGEPVIQVITPHTIVVLLKEGEVTKVTTDGKFNEMTGKMID